MVHRCYQVFDVGRVERGYESFSQRSHDLPRYLICFILESCYLSAAAKHIIIFLQQCPKCMSGRERDLSMASEEVEESFLFWHQGPKPAEHERLARTKSCRRRQPARYRSLNR